MQAMGEPTLPPSFVAAEGVSVASYSGATGGDVYVLLWQGASDPVEMMTEAAQTALHTTVTNLLSSGVCSTAKPLLLLNPYGTSTSGLVVGMPNAGAGTLSFRIVSPGLTSWEGRVANHAAAGQGFLGQVVGLVPGVSNVLTLVWQPTTGARRTTVVTIRPPAAKRGFERLMTRTLSRTEKELSAGLFALSDTRDHGHTNLLVDNHGVLRGEIVSRRTAVHRPFPLTAARMVTNLDEHTLGVIDGTGRVTKVIDLGQHLFIHHDLEVVGPIVYVLASDSRATHSEDMVLAVDWRTGQVVRTIQMSEVLPNYLARTHPRAGATVNDWVHLNSVHVSGGTMYLSCREPSTIVALDGALAHESGRATVRYLIGPPAVWKGTGYEDLLLTKKGRFSANAGQHMVLRHDSDELGEGQYYLEFFNNNFWYMGTLDGWEELGPKGASRSASAGASQLMRYLVDEKAGTYAQDLRVDVPYSTIMGSVQRTGDGGLDQNVVVGSTKAHNFSEHTRDGKVIASYDYADTSGAYRVYKHDYHGYWFA